MKSITTAAVVAGFALAAQSASAALKIHIEGLSWGVWITIGNPLYSNLNAQGTAGTASYNEPGLDPNMGFLFPLNNGLVATGAEVTNAMGHHDFSGLGGQDLSLASWGVWITWRDYGIHITGGSNFLASLPLQGVTPDGQFRYENNNLAIPITAEVVNPDQSVDQYALDVTRMAWTSDPRVPAPGAAAAFGAFGALVGARRRRRA